MHRLLPLLLLSAPLFAADPPKEKGTKYAFLVAAAEYDTNELRPLPFSGKETAEFREVLLAAGFAPANVRFLHDRADKRYLPERRKIADELDLLLSKAAADDTVVVLLNGHGVHFSGDRTGYFCPVDAKLSDKATLVPMDGTGGVFEQLKACKAKRKVLLVNACRNDPRSDLSLAGDKIKLDDDDKDEVPEGIAALYSCKPGEKSYYYDPKDAKSKGRERSLFMHHLIEAWGKGGKTTIEDVFAAVRQGASDDADQLFRRKQNPVVRREIKGQGEWLTGGWPGEGEYKKGFALESGLGAKIDHKAALAHFRTAAEVGHPLAMAFVARYLREGQLTSKDDKAAEQFDHRALPDIREAAEFGRADAQRRLAIMYEGGRGGLKQDDSEAAKWYRRAAEQGHAPAENNLAFWYQNGWGGLKQDDAEAVKWYRKAADQGYPNGQTNMGFMCQSGRGVTKDDAEAVKWYRKAADQGDSMGQANLGTMYDQGWGVKQDDAEAVRWYRKAADQGNPTGQNQLGLMYQHGRGVKADDAEAVRWFRKAADQNDAAGQNNLGFMYSEGRGGLTKDDAEALKWIRKAVDQGFAAAMNQLAVMYAEGRGGLKQDLAEAVLWLRKAADQGNAPAQTNLGIMYENGFGVAKDVSEAVKWYQLAAKQGNPDAKANLKRLGK